MLYQLVFNEIEKNIVHNSLNGSKSDENATDSTSRPTTCGLFLLVSSTKKRAETAVLQTESA